MRRFGISSLKIQILKNLLKKINDSENFVLIALDYPILEKMVTLTECSRKSCFHYDIVNNYRALSIPCKFVYATLDSYQFGFAPNAQKIFRHLCKPKPYKRLQRLNLVSTFCILYISGLFGWRIDNLILVVLNVVVK